MYKYMNIVILLHTTINTRDNISWLKQRNSKERKEMYDTKIRSWLDKTNFKIVVVENSGHKFENFRKPENVNKNSGDFSELINDRFEIISFKYSKEQEKIMNKLVAKGQHEILSVEYACKNSSLIKNCEYVIKITGRYFIPSLEKILTMELKNRKVDFIRQSLLWRNMVRSEIYGCSKEKINSIFYFPLKNDEIEQEVMDRMKSSNSILKLPKMKLDKKTRMGAGPLMEYL